MDNDVINELLALIDSMAERIEALELAKNEQDAINTLLTEQIVAMNNCIRETQDRLKAMQLRETRKLDGVDYDVMAKLRRAGSKGPRRQMPPVVPGSPAQTSKTFREPGAGATSAGTIAKGATLADATRSRACMGAVPGMEVWAEARRTSSGQVVSKAMSLRPRSAVHPWTTTALLKWAAHRWWIEPFAKTPASSHLSVSWSL